MQPIHVSERVAKRSLGNDTARDRCCHEKKQKGKPKLAKSWCSVATKAQKVQEREVREERGLEKYSCKVVSLIRKGQESARKLGGINAKAEEIRAESQKCF